jgi:Flp pilus assembly protein TadG
VVRLLPSADRRGQTLVETALILPIFIAVVMGIIVFGIGLFYQQQVTTAAREAARYAAIHSASSSAPVCGHLAQTALADAVACADTPAAGWPAMTAHARGFANGLDASQLHITACWSGYRDFGNPTTTYDQGPVWANDGTTPNPWADCTMTGSSINPLTGTGSLPCPATTSSGADNDKASNLAVSNRDFAIATNRVVVYACYDWSPPLAGFLGIPQTITLKAVVSEGLQHQR